MDGESYIILQNAISKPWIFKASIVTEKKYFNFMFEIWIIFLSYSVSTTQTFQCSVALQISITGIDAKNFISSCEVDAQ